MSQAAGGGALKAAGDAVAEHLVPPWECPSLHDALVASLIMQFHHAGPCQDPPSRVATDNVKGLVRAALERGERPARDAPLSRPGPCALLAVGWALGAGNPATVLRKAGGGGDERDLIRYDTRSLLPGMCLRRAVINAFVYRLRARPTSCGPARVWGRPESHVLLVPQRCAGSVRAHADR
jgi:hypothetical protein